MEWGETETVAIRSGTISGYRAWTSLVMMAPNMVSCSGALFYLHLLGTVRVTSDRPNVTGLTEMVRKTRNRLIISLWLDVLSEIPRVSYNWPLIGLTLHSQRDISRAPISTVMGQSGHVGREFSLFFLLTWVGLGLNLTWIQSLD